MVDDGCSIHRFVQHVGFYEDDSIELFDGRGLLNAGIASIGDIFHSCPFLTNKVFCAEIGRCERCLAAF